MPSEYRCEACGLSFSLGWFQTGVDPDFDGETMCVCAECGTRHDARIARRTGGEEIELFHLIVKSYPLGARLAVLRELARIGGGLAIEWGPRLDELPLRVVRCPEREALLHAESLKAHGVKTEVRPAGKGPNPSFVPPKQRDRLCAWPGPFIGEGPAARSRVGHRVRGETKEPYGEFNLKAQVCAHCGAEGSLISAFPEGGMPCPNCKKPRLKDLGGWTT